MSVGEGLNSDVEQSELYQLEVKGIGTVTCLGDPTCTVSTRYMTNAIARCIDEICAKHNAKRDQKHYTCHGDLTGNADLVMHRLFAKGGCM